MGKNLKGKELGKNLSQRKDGRYEAKYTDNFGKRHSIYGEKLADVRRQLTEALYQNEHSIYNVNCVLTVDEWFKIWMETYKVGKVRNGTLVRLYRYYEHHVKDSIGALLLKKVNAVMIQKLYNKLIDYPLSQGEIAHIHCMLNNLFKQAIANNFMMKNPCENLSFKSKIEKKNKKPLTLEEQELFFEYAKATKYYNLYCIMLLTGMRIGEVLALTWNDICFANRTISINKTTGELYPSEVQLLKKYKSNIISDNATEKIQYLNPPKTKKSKRIIPLCDAAIEILTKMYNEKDNGVSLVFMSKNKTTICRSTINSAIRRVIKKIENDHPDVELSFVSCHTFRHTFATRCFENNIPPKVVQEYLGHTTLKMTMDLYTHVSFDLQNKEICKINNII